MMVADKPGFITPHLPGLRTKETAEWLAVKDGFRLYLVTSLGATADTVGTYLYGGSLFARWCEQEGEPFTIAGREAVARFITWNLEHRSASLAANRLYAIRAFFRWAVAEGLRQDDPTDGIKVKREHAQSRQPYTDAELRALLRACRDQRDRALIFLLLATGIRRGEAIGLETNDIDWNEGIIRIRKGKGRRQRNVGVGAAILSELRAYVGERTGQVWVRADGMPMVGQQIYKALRKLGKRAGVNAVGAHRFRNTFATRILSDGGDLGALQTAMGHSNPTMTLHYAAYGQEKRALDMQRSQRFAGIVADDSADEEAEQEGDVALKVDAARARYNLTPEQLETLRLLASGITRQEMADELGISRGAASSRLALLLRRLGAKNNMEACVRAARDGLLSEPTEEAQESDGAGGAGDATEERQEAIAEAARDRRTVELAALKQRFTKALSEGVSITAAAKAVGVARITFYGWRDKDPEFRAVCDEARERVRQEKESADKLQEARQEITRLEDEIATAPVTNALARPPKPTRKPPAKEAADEENEEAINTTAEDAAGAVAALKQRVIKILAEGHGIMAAMRAVGMSRSALYSYRHADPEFRAAWEEAMVLAYGPVPKRKRKPKANSAAPRPAALGGQAGERGWRLIK